VISGIEAINICTGLVSDDRLLTKGNEVFGRNCYGAGDAMRIGEGTSAVLRGRQVAYEILDALHCEYDYNAYLAVSKEYIDSQQRPVRVLEQPILPPLERRDRPFVLIDCLYGFACNPCAFACPFGAISKSSTSSVPYLDFEKCVGCMQCISQCPGLAVFGYDLQQKLLYLPCEHDVKEGEDVILVNNDGAQCGEGRIEKVLLKPTKTHVVKIRVSSVGEEDLLLRERVTVPGAADLRTARQTGRIGNIRLPLRRREAR
jgi:Fe-S-cluster-containing hydrogenase component 2